MARACSSATALRLCHTEVSCLSVMSFVELPHLQIAYRYLYRYMRLGSRCLRSRNVLRVLHIQRNIFGALRQADGPV